MSQLIIRTWQQSDDPSLKSILQGQMAQDTSWPPAYARNLDLAQWLAQPADLYRWVAIFQNRVIGHIGLGSLATDKAAAFCSAVDAQPEQFAEICRTVVDPNQRIQGTAAQLTRRAIKTALQNHRIPVATVLTSRTTWLQMMKSTGWQPIADQPATNPSERLICLLPPQKFIDPVLTYA